ncbi:tRNA (adenosine(37)-N6)-dimethylallyltransferase MiaA [Aureicoccus marinus]|uniref:tRNA dimethylallyltransferase n=1 Tax=Aureicoccus marinus TaxID=754435 RepID=A0A2S7T5E5_9FLAO|nr:tRNA (adenosine(37)-N6)-dimethylallyltransferase MiaA [Aureicoccus marinus]PQJ14874.1 hypothetical protein BST99_03200 [Aureicoccus marinus]
MEKNSTTLAALVGPTAIGKTAFSIALAQHWKTEIISADSRQFYREMRIGTAVPSTEELRQVPHHFIQHRSISEEYSAAQFAQEAEPLVQELLQTKGKALVVGGSGLYTDALIQGLNDFPAIPEKIRKEVRELFAEKELEGLQMKLNELDPEYAQQVDFQNPMRLMRALEVCLASGKPYSTFRKGPDPSLKNKLYIGLAAERSQIYARIEQRVDLMMDEGLLEEARNLYEHRKLNALNTVGYKELFSHLSGECSLEEAVDAIKTNTRRFAKRQLTWYRKNKKINWLPTGWSNERKLAQVDSWIQKKQAAPVLLVMGVSGCGKSSLANAIAQRLDITYLDADDYHPEENIAKMKSGKPLNDKDRLPWLQKLALVLLDHQDKGVVLACSALKGSYRDLLNEYLRVQTIYLQGNFDYLYQRLNKRKGHFMPPELLQSQFQALEEPEDAIRISVEWPLEEAVENALDQLEH